MLQWLRRPAGGLEPVVAWRQAAWRRRWLGLGVASLIGLPGWAGTLLLPDHSRSSALLFADPGPGVVLEDVAGGRTAAALAALQSALLAPAARERIVGGTITIATEGPSLFRVSYHAEQPDAAERTLQALVDLVTSRVRAPPAADAPPGSVAAKMQASRDQATALRHDLAAALALRAARARRLVELPPVFTAGRRNPAYDEAAIQLGQQEALVASLRSQLAAAEAAIAELGGQLQAGAGDEELRGKRPDLRVAPTAGIPGPVFRIVGPPSRPSEPESGLRLLLLAGVTAAAVLGGAAIAVWRGRLEGIADTAIQLEHHFRRPVLGTISLPCAPGEQRRQRQARVNFGLACLGLLALFGGLAGAEALDLLAPLSGR